VLRLGDRCEKRGSSSRDSVFESITVSRHSTDQPPPRYHAPSPLLLIHAYSPPPNKSQILFLISICLPSPNTSFTVYLPPNPSLKPLPAATMPVTSGQLTDFDYSLRVVTSSSTITATQTPLLSLKLSLKQPDGTTKNETVEMSSSEIDALLSKMDEVEKRTLELQHSS